MQSHTLAQEFFMPSNFDQECQQIEQNPHLNEYQTTYNKAVFQMLATILQTKRQMQATGQQPTPDNPNFNTQFQAYHDNSPQLVTKIQQKFKKFNLSLEQLLKFIRFQQSHQSRKPDKTQANRIIKIEDTQQNTQNQNRCKVERRNLVEVYRMNNRRKYSRKNPRAYN